MSMNSKLSFDVPKIDCEQVAAEIEASIRQTVFKRFHKKGAVVGISGGIDSSCVAALCARALGSGRVQGLLMPEGDSAASDESTELGHLLADSQGVDVIVEDITAALDGLGCYRRRDEAIRAVIPEYGPGWKSKIVLPSVVDSDRYS